ncbi:MAG: GerMN domain-containing protein [Spirochaetaceae bacterium]|jgi:hypothetical protein|nr:GerMN domain-containing protein [Spirochaetaceae bacterium]
MKGIGTALLRAGNCALRLALLAGLGMFAVYELMSLPVERRTFVFYGIGTGKAVVEERMLPRYPEAEQEITRYVEEVLLGPVLPKTAPLFCRDTALRSLLYRNGAVYADLSEYAVLPPVEDEPLQEGGLDRRLQTLAEGIRRNFPAVREIKLFINGNPIQD